MTEYRSAPIRASKSQEPGVTLKIITPNVVDDYGSVWLPDTFDAFLRSGANVALCWSHSWLEPLGPMKSYRLGAGGPEIDFAFSNFDDVPIARRAWSQVKDGTLTDCSVGFFGIERRDPTRDEKQRWPAAREVIVRAGLDEVSLVLRGAVPGAKVLAVRRRPSSRMSVDAALARVRGERPTPSQLDAELDAALDSLRKRDWWRE